MNDVNTSKPAIELKGLIKIFGSQASSFVGPVQRGMRKDELLAQHNHVLGLRDINMAIPEGSIQVIMGLSGSGKSTLIRHINRLIEPSAGEVLISGVDVLKMSREQLRDFRQTQTAMVFQKFALFPHWTVLENTGYGLLLRGVAESKRVETARYWIERVGLKGFENRYPDQLSGGMQQRVGLARALTNDAPILLMDEAFSALDPLIRTDMQSILLELQSELKKTIVFITHDLDEALRLGDQITILRDGVIIQQGRSDDIILRPADDYVAKFVKEVNRARFIHVSNIMRPLSEADSTEGPRIGVDASLEAAAQLLRQSEAGSVRVVDRLGKIVGILDMNLLLNAMVMPAEAPGSQTL